MKDSQAETISLRWPVGFALPQPRRNEELRCSTRNKCHAGLTRLWKASKYVRTSVWEDLELRKANPSGLRMFCPNGTQQQVYKRIKVNKDLKEAANNKKNNCKTTAERYESLVK